MLIEEMSTRGGRGGEGHRRTPPSSGGVFVQQPSRAGGGGRVGTPKNISATTSPFQRWLRRAQAPPYSGGRGQHPLRGRGRGPLSSGGGGGGRGVVSADAPQNISATTSPFKHIEPPLQNAREGISNSQPVVMAAEANEEAEFQALERGFCGLTDEQLSRDESEAPEKVKSRPLAKYLNMTVVQTGVVLGKVKPTLGLSQLEWELANCGIFIHWHGRLNEVAIAKLGLCEVYISPPDEDSKSGIASFVLNKGKMPITSPSIKRHALEIVLLEILSPPGFQTCEAASSLCGHIRPFGRNYGQAHSGFIFGAIDEVVDSSRDVKATKLVDIHMLSLIDDGHRISHEDVLRMISHSQSIGRYEVRSKYLLSLPATRHGSRIIAGFVRNQIVIGSDTRTTIDMRGQEGVVLTVDNNASKSRHFGAGIVGAYVGDEDLWNMACTFLYRLCSSPDVKKGKKKVKETAVPNIKDLSYRLFALLKTANLGREGEGIILILGQHKNFCPRIYQIVVNSDYDIKDDFKEGVTKFKPCEREGVAMEFYAYGGGFEATIEYLKNISYYVKKWTLQAFIDTIRSGILYAFFDQPCVGGNVEVLRMDTTGRVMETKERMLSCYMDLFEDFEDTGMVLVFVPTILPFVTCEQINTLFGNISSWVQEFGRIINKPGDPTLNMIGSLDVFCLLFDTKVEAGNAFERAIDFIPRYKIPEAKFPGVKCAKIGDSHAFLQLSSRDFLNKLRVHYYVL